MPVTTRGDTGGQTWRPLFWILLGALILRGALAIGAWSATGDSAVFAPDTFTYLTPARELLLYGTFTTGGQPEVIRTPGYPLLLIPGILLGHVRGVTTALQIALSLFTAVGVYALGLALVDSRRAGLAAAAIYALEPASIAYTAYLLTETLAATLLVWAVWLLVRYTRSGRLPHLAAGIALLAAVAYVRPVAVFLPACVVAFFTLRALLSRRPRAVAHAAIAGMVALALLAPWSLRNRAADFPGFSAIGALFLYFHTAGQILAEQNGISPREQATRMGWPLGAGWAAESYLQLHPEQRTWSPGRRYQYMQREGARIVGSHLPPYARIHARAVFYTLFSTGGGELRALFGRPGPPLRFVERLRQGASDWMDLVHVGLALFLFALYGLVACRLFSASLGASTLLVLGSVAYFIVVANAEGDTRFRVPAMPMVCALAGAGLLTLRFRGVR